VTENSTGLSCNRPTLQNHSSASSVPAQNEETKELRIQTLTVAACTVQKIAAHTKPVLIMKNASDEINS
jgi:hypothetical protein